MLLLQFLAAINSCFYGFRENSTVSKIGILNLKTQNVYDVTIIGGGIIGAATAYKLQKAYPEVAIQIIEKEKAVATHQTGNNSGVIHSGLYYKPGSVKSRTCVEGRKELVKFAKKFGIKHDICGKVVVATEDRELPYLDKIFHNGIANGTEGIQRITAEEIKEIEPQCAGVAGIWVPCTGIIDFRKTTEKLVQLMLATQKRSQVTLGEEVTDILQGPDISTVTTNRATHQTRKIICCGGLWSDKLARKDNVKVKEKIVGFRGDYYRLAEQGKHKVRNLIYPVPNPQFPFLGVHFSRMIDGEIECGPNAVFTFKREGYSKSDFSLRDTVDALSYTGTWKLLFKHFNFALGEYKRAFSKKLFFKTLQKLVPSLTIDDIEPGRAGVRAMLLGEDGEMIEDFKIMYQGNSIHVLNAPSPAATACLSIGNEITAMAGKYFNLN